MPRRRGPSNENRFAVYMANATSTGAIVSAPCFVYCMDFTVSDGTTSALFAFADTTAATDVTKETAKFMIKMGTALSSGNSDNHEPIYFNPPLNIANQLFWASATGIASVNVNVLY